MWLLAVKQKEEDKMVI